MIPGFKFKDKRNKSKIISMNDENNLIDVDQERTVLEKLKDDLINE